MRSHEQTNGDSEGGESGNEGGAEEAEWCITEDGAAERLLSRLNALRKSRQHYDVLLLAGGAELPAHRAVLAAASPRLLRELPPTANPAELRLDVDPDALKALLDYVYTGRLQARDSSAALVLLRAAAELRLSAARDALADRLLRRPTPHAALDLRALPGLNREQLKQLDQYITDNFDDICECGALASLPLIQIEMFRESSAQDGKEAPAAVAEAALTWLRDAAPPDAHLDELCSRTHLLYVNDEGTLRDCGDMPSHTSDAPELSEYRRAAAERGPSGALLPPAAADAEWRVLSARGDSRATRALLVLRGTLVALKVVWRRGAAGVRRGARLAGGGGARAALRAGRCAGGAAELGGRLIICGGYEASSVLRSTEAYEPSSNSWSRLADMLAPRARFSAARIDHAIYAPGGSDGHNELDTVEALVGGRWEVRARMPAAVAHAAAVPAGGRLYVVGGWAAGRPLKSVYVYQPDTDAWTDGPPLNMPRSQCAGQFWAGSVWAVGGCDQWRCTAATERLAPPAAAAAAAPAAPAWEAGPPLLTARRATAAATWRDMLWVAGGSDGAASLKSTERLSDPESAWVAGPPLRRCRAAPALASLGPALYCCGGFSGRDFLACVEALSDPHNEWTALLDAPNPHHHIVLKQNGEEIIENGEEVLENGDQVTNNEAEAIVNSLAHVSADPDNPTTLSRFHFLIETSSNQALPKAFENQGLIV